MKKSIIALAVAAASIAPMMAEAGAPEVSGFADIIFTAVDDTAPISVADGSNTLESKFAADGEIDFKGNLADDVSVRVDLDVDLGGGQSGDIEQAFFGWKMNDDVTLIGGVFNNPIGWEAEDAPDLYQTSHSQNYDILDGQTALRGNNIAGVAVAGSVGDFTLTAALLNDLQQANEENSLALVVGFSPNEDLSLEAGIVTQEGGAETVLDLNATYKIDDITAAAEILIAEEIIDYSAMAMVNMPIPDTSVSVTARGEIVSYTADIDDTMVATFAGLYTVNEALGIVGEVRYLDGETNDGDIQVVAEFIASF
ncbi:MAG: porin [Gammaproteobacteria bacterium]|nr:porin [Gammaproteobacteria bacterium]